MWQPHFLLYLIPEFDRRNIIYFVFLLYRPESEQFREMLGVFYFQKQIRKPGAGKEVMQMPRMPKYLKREWAFFLGDCGRKKYNPLPSNKLLKGAQLICNKPFFRIFARLNIQNTDFVFIRHCNNSFFDNKNTAVSGDTAGGNKEFGELCRNLL